MGTRGLEAVVPGNLAFVWKTHLEIEMCLMHSAYAQRSLRKRAHKEDGTVLATVIDAAFMLQLLLKKEVSPVPLLNSFSAAGGHKPLRKPVSRQHERSCLEIPLFGNDSPFNH